MIGWGWGWGAAWVSGGASGTVFEDTFTDDNGTGLPDHTPDTDNSGNGWTENSGDFVISANAIVTNEDSAEHIATCGPGIADCTVQCNVRYYPNTADMDIGLVVRADSDASNYWRVVCDPANSLLEITKCESGEAPSAEASTAITDDFQDNTWYTLKAVCADARITAYCIYGENEDSVYHEEEWMNTETRYGIYGYHKVAEDTMDFDSFSIEV